MQYRLVSPNVDQNIIFRQAMTNENERGARSNHHSNNAKSIEHEFHYYEIEVSTDGYGRIYMCKIINTAVWSSDAQLYCGSHTVDQSCTCTCTFYM